MFSSSLSARDDPGVRAIRQRLRREARHRKRERQARLREESKHWVQDVIPASQQTSEDVEDNPYYQPHLLPLGSADGPDEEPVDWDAYRDQRELSAARAAPPECAVFTNTPPTSTIPADGTRFPTRRPLDSVLRKEYDRAKEYVDFCTPTKIRPKNHIVTKRSQELIYVNDEKSLQLAEDKLLPLIHRFKFLTLDTESNIHGYDFDKYEAELGDVKLLVIGAPPHQVAVYNLDKLYKIGNVRRILGRLYQYLADEETFVLGIAIHQVVDEVHLLDIVVDGDP